jgi:hypothetical protein
MSQSFNINPDDKFYPGHHVWSYSTFLGKFTDSEGNNFDLGIYLDKSGTCDATVHSNDPSDYSSGEINLYTSLATVREFKKEVYRRARILNLIQ